MRFCPYYYRTLSGTVDDRLTPRRSFVILRAVPKRPPDRSNRFQRSKRFRRRRRFRRFRRFFRKNERILPILLIESAVYADYAIADANKVGKNFQKLFHSTLFSLMKNRLRYDYSYKEKVIFTRLSGYAAYPGFRESFDAFRAPSASTSRPPSQRNDAETTRLGRNDQVFVFRWSRVANPSASDESNERNALRERRIARRVFPFVLRRRRKDDFFH